MITEQLERLISSYEPYCEPRDATPEEEAEMISASKEMLAEISRVTEGVTVASSLWSKSFTITRNLADLSGRFLFGLYSDSDTDAPCDLEYDLCKLREALDPEYSMPSPDEVQPAYVMATAFASPEND